MSAEVHRSDEPDRRSQRDRAARERKAAAARLRGATEALSVLQGRGSAEQRQAARFATGLLRERAATADWGAAGLPAPPASAPPASARPASGLPVSRRPASEPPASEPPAARLPAAADERPVFGVPLDDRSVLLLARCALRLRCAEIRAADRPAYWSRLADFFARYLPAGADELIRLRAAVVNVRLDTGDTSPEIISALRAAIDYCRDAHGEDAYRTGLARANLSTAYRQRGTGTDLADSTALAEREKAARTARYGGDHPVTLVARSLLALSLLVQAEAAADAGERIRLARRALAENTQVRVARDRVYGLASAPAAVTRRYEARALLLLGDPDKARACLEYTVALERARGDGKESHSHGQTHYHLSRAYHALGQHDEAREHAEQARRIFSLDRPRGGELRRTAALMEELATGEV